MKTFLFQKLNLHPTIKQELINVTNKVRTDSFELEQISEDNTNFLLLSPFANICNPKNTHIWNNLEKISWQQHIDRGTITKEFLDKFNFLNINWSFVSNKDQPFRYHRHHHASSDGRIVSYQVMVTYGNSILEYAKPLNFNDTTTDPANDMFSSIPEDVETEIINRCNCDDLEVYIMNSWIYHTLLCEHFTRIAIWHPPVSNIYEAYRYINYVEGLR